MTQFDAIHPALAEALAARGYATLTPVQQQMLEPEVAGRDLLVSAQTGSGKTVAFGMAIAPTLLGDEAKFGAPGAPLALLIAPTRELALQVQRELQWLYAGTGAQIAAGVGGMDIRTERRALERGAHIVVGTPGRLRDHIGKGALDLSAIRATVLDEADEMLDLGFREDLEFILGAAPEGRRTLMFSATVPAAIAELAQSFQHDALRVTATAEREQHADIDYQVIAIQNDEREHAVINLLLLHDQSNAIVFCHTREAVKHLTARLANRGFPVVALSGELTQAERSNALLAMRDGRARVCVATDVAARGIDLPNLALVIHADIPSNPETLLHRSGRTGRAGNKGICALVVPIHRRSVAARVLKLAGLSFSMRSAPSMADIDRHNRESILASVAELAPVEAEEAPFVAELLQRLTPEQLAAAYLRRELGTRPAPEEISDRPLPPLLEKPPRRDKRFLDDGPGAVPRGKPEPLTDGRWFTLSLGRNRRADPKWLLPMICKFGDVTRKDVGSIKIGDNETRFEVSAEKAGAFIAALARTGGEFENGIVIAPAGSDAPRPPRKAKPDAGPRYKVRSDKGHKLFTKPAAEITAPLEEVMARPDAIRPVKAKVNPKDKGKPKYKNRVKHDPPADAGAKPRKKKPGYDPLG